MKAPIDKLHSGVNNIIQIIITHRCDLSCSNCTQAVAYGGNKYDMSLDVFREAVNSLSDWPGIVGIFGGNPVLHPRFRDICQILTETIKPKNRGLWSNNLFNSGRIVRDTFYPEGTFNLNAHGNRQAFEAFEKWVPGKAIQESKDRKSWHSPIFTAIKDFVGSQEIPDEKEMWKIIENCPINNDWSGAIYEREGMAVASFCEVAAMFDILYGTNTGLPVGSGDWWKLHIKSFSHQVEKWCPQCGIPLNLKGQLDSEETDDFSKSHLGLVNIRPFRPMEIHNTLPNKRAPRATDYERIRTNEEVLK